MKKKSLIFLFLALFPLFLLAQSITYFNKRSRLEHPAAKAQDAYTMIRHVLADSTGIDHTLYRAWLANVGDIQADYAIVQDFMQAGEIASAQSFLQSLPLTYNLCETDLAEYNSFADWLNFCTTHPNIGGLDSTALDTLRNIANNGTGLAAEKAQNILQVLYNENYERVPQFPEPQSQARFAASTPSNPFSLISVAPNPAKDWTTLSYRLPFGEKAGIIEVIDVLGKSVFTQQVTQETAEIILPTKEWSNGVYFYHLTVNGKNIASDKLIIQK